MKVCVCMFIHVSAFILMCKYPFELLRESLLNLLLFCFACQSFIHYHRFNYPKCTSAYVAIITSPVFVLFFLVFCGYFAYQENNGVQNTELGIRTVLVVPTHKFTEYREIFVLIEIEARAHNDEWIFFYFFEFCGHHLYTIKPLASVNVPYRHRQFHKWCWYMIQKHLWN